MKNAQKNIKFYSDNLLIKGVLHLPATDQGMQKPPVVIGSHGLEGSKNSAKQISLSKILPENGIAFLRFDHRGCGDSEGEFLKDTSVFNRASDFTNAVKYILEHEKLSHNIGIFGSSLGGSTCIQAWDSLSLMDIKLSACVLCSTPVKSRTIENIPVHDQPNQYSPALPMSFFIEKLNFDLSEKTSRIKNVLIFHGTNDEIVPAKNARIIYENAMEPKQLILFKNGDHQVSSKKDQIRFEQETLKWFKKALV